MIHILLLRKKLTKLKLKYLHVISPREVCFVCSYVFVQYSKHPVVNAPLLLTS